MNERDHLIELLRETKKGIKKHDIVLLRDLSNKTVHSSSIEQNPIYIVVAVIVYSISKILERGYDKYSTFNEFINKIVDHIDKAIKFLENNKDEEFCDELKKIRKDISKESGNFRKHLEDVFRKAMINKASRIYEHGISMSRTADLLGITLFELAEYIGKTRISDVDLNVTMPIKKRIKIVEEIFEK